MLDFDLAEAVRDFKDDSESFEINDDVDETRQAFEELNSEFASMPAAIIENENEPQWDRLVDLVRSYPALSNPVQNQVIYFVANALRAAAEDARGSFQRQAVDDFPMYKQLFSQYGFLAYMLLTYLAKEDAEYKNPKAKKRTEHRNKALISLLHEIGYVLHLDKLSSYVFKTTNERNLFVGTLFVAPANALLEDPARVKVAEVKDQVFRVLCLAVKFHMQASQVQSAIIQHLTYFEHLSVPMAELLQRLTDQFGYSQLTDSVLREVSTKSFNENDAKGPKSIGRFLVRLSELEPFVMMRQGGLVSDLVDNNSFTLRCSVVEVIGNVIATLARSQEEYDQHKEQGIDYIDMLEKRLLDTNPFVRSRSLQGLGKLTDMNVKFIDRRLLWTKLAVRHLDDRSSLVRRNAVKFLHQLILSHPYGAISDQTLSMSEWRKKALMLREKLIQYQPEMFEDEQGLDLLGLAPEKTEEDDEEEKQEEEEGDDKEDADSDVEMEDDEKDEDEDKEEDKQEAEAEKDAEKKDDEEPAAEKKQVTISPDLPPIDPETLGKLQLTYHMMKDCLYFIRYIEEALSKGAELLHSRNKLEQIDVMDFFILGDAYKVENVKKGVKEMLHLVWMKGTNEDSNRVVDKLIDSYKAIYLTAPPDISQREKDIGIATQLIQLTYDASMADLASLEKLMGEFYEKKMITPDTIGFLWSFFEDANVPRKMKRGAIIILGMLAVVDNRISLSGLDQILSIGLDPEAAEDDWILTSFACVALRRAIPAKSDAQFELSKNNEAIEKLKAVLLKYSNDGQWFAMAEEALNTLYTISKHPDDDASDILRRKAQDVFSGEHDKVAGLSQLLFLVGHIGLKTLIYLEKCEAEFKKKKIAAESKKSAEDNELDMIGGTNEDDFSDAVQAIKEKEMLYSDQSMLAHYIPIVKEIVDNPKEYNNSGLQRQAILCLCKLMCISPQFCEDNLGILLDVMQNSEDSVVRSNAVLGLGDMAVCFNTIIDTNKGYLYGRLQDEDLTVQRTCLMTVTFLILAGQVKVKGQLAEMAKLYVNKDPAIRDMCKLFFTELATKENAIYNGYMDMFSGLTADEQLKQPDFCTIVKYVSSFIERDRHRQQLVSKLYQRLSLAEDQQTWEQTAFTIKEIIPRLEMTSSSRKDKESAKLKMYDEVLKSIEAGFKRPEQIQV